MAQAPPTRRVQFNTGNEPPKVTFNSPLSNANPEDTFNLPGDNLSGGSQPLSPNLGQRGQVIPGVTRVPLAGAEGIQNILEFYGGAYEYLDRLLPGNPFSEEILARIGERRKNLPTALAEESDVPVSQILEGNDSIINFIAEHASLARVFKNLLREGPVALTFIGASLARAHPLGRLLSALNLSTYALSASNDKYKEFEDNARRTGTVLNERQALIGSAAVGLLSMSYELFSLNRLRAVSRVAISGKGIKAVGGVKDALDRQGRAMSDILGVENKVAATFINLGVAASVESMTEEAELLTATVADIPQLGFAEAFKDFGKKSHETIYNAYTIGLMSAGVHAAFSQPDGAKVLQAEIDGQKIKERYINNQMETLELSGITQDEFYSMTPAEREVNIDKVVRDGLVEANRRTAEYTTDIMYKNPDSEVGTGEVFTPDEAAAHGFSTQIEIDAALAAGQLPVGDEAFSGGRRLIQGYRTNRGRFVEEQIGGIPSFNFRVARIRAMLYGVFDIPEGNTLMGGVEPENLTLRQFQFVIGKLKTINVTIGEGDTKETVNIVHAATVRMMKTVGESEMSALFGSEEVGKITPQFNHESIDSALLHKSIARLQMEEGNITKAVEQYPELMAEYRKTLNKYHKDLVQAEKVIKETNVDDPNLDIDGTLQYMTAIVAAWRQNSDIVTKKQMETALDNLNKLYSLYHSNIKGKDGREAPALGKRTTERDNDIKGAIAYVKDVLTEYQYKMDVVHPIFRPTDVRSLLTLPQVLRRLGSKDIKFPPPRRNKEGDIIQKGENAGIAKLRAVRDANGKQLLPDAELNFIKAVLKQNGNPEKLSHKEFITMIEEAFYPIKMMTATEIVLTDDEFRKIPHQLSAEWQAVRNRKNPEEMRQFLEENAPEIDTDKIRFDEQFAGTTALGGQQDTYVEIMMTSPAFADDPGFPREHHFQGISGLLGWIRGDEVEGDSTTFRILEAQPSTPLKGVRTYTDRSALVGFITGRLRSELNSTPGSIFASFNLSEIIDAIPYTQDVSFTQRSITLGKVVKKGSKSTKFKFELGGKHMGYMSIKDAASILADVISPTLKKVNLNTPERTYAIAIANMPNKAMIKAAIQWAAERGYKNVLLPTGETIGRIEHIQNLEENIELDIAESKEHRSTANLFDGKFTKAKIKKLLESRFKSLKEGQTGRRTVNIYDIPGVTGIGSAESIDGEHFPRFLIGDALTPVDSNDLRLSINGFSALDVPRRSDQGRTEVEVLKEILQIVAKHAQNKKYNLEDKWRDLWVEYASTESSLYSGKVTLEMMVDILHALPDHLRQGIVEGSLLKEKSLQIRANTSRTLLATGVTGVRKVYQKLGDEFLKKIKPETTVITDEHKNTWFKIPITLDDRRTPIDLLGPALLANEDPKAPKMRPFPTFSFAPDVIQRFMRSTEGTVAGPPPGTAQVASAGGVPILPRHQAISKDAKGFFTRLMSLEFLARHHTSSVTKEMPDGSVKTSTMSLREHVTQLVEADMEYKMNISAVTDHLRNIQDSLSESEQEGLHEVMEAVREDDTKALGKIKNSKIIDAAIELDKMLSYYLVRAREYLRDMYRITMEPEMVSAFHRAVDQGISTDQIAREARPKRRDHQLLFKGKLEKLIEHYNDINTWGLDNFMTKIEGGTYRIFKKNKKGELEIVLVAFTQEEAVTKTAAMLKEGKITQGEAQDGLFIDNSITLDKVSDNGQAINRMRQSLRSEVKGRIDDFSKLVHASVGSEYKRMKITGTGKFAAPFTKRKGLLEGYKNPFDAMYSYVYSVEKKMALDPVVAMWGMERSMFSSSPNLVRALDKTIEATKGQYWLLDRWVDEFVLPLQSNKIIGKFISGKPMVLSRAVGKARMVMGQLLLGYRPIAGMMNFAKGQANVLVELGSASYIEGWRMLKTDEGKKLLRQNQRWFGIDIAVDVENAGRFDRKKWYDLSNPLGFFKAAEPINREIAFLAGYAYAKKEGKSDQVATMFARNVIRTTNFVYNMASLPAILRGPGGKAVGQFKSYLIRDIERMIMIKEKNGVMPLLRELGMFAALAGPQGIIYIARSLPMLAAFGILDDLEEFFDEQHPAMSRGVFGLAGGDVTAPAVVQLPHRLEDWMGPVVSQMYRLYKEMIIPQLEGTGYLMEDSWDWATSIMPAMYYWGQLWDTYTTPDGWIKNEFGDRVISIQTDWEKAYLAMGINPLSKKKIENALRRIRNDDERNSILITKTVRKIADALDPDLNRSALSNLTRRSAGIPEELISRAISLRISSEAIILELRDRRLTPSQRTIIRSRLVDRIDRYTRFENIR